MLSIFSLTLLNVMFHIFEQITL